MTATHKSLTDRQLDWALHAAARWLAPGMGYEHEAPVGQDAANSGAGPMLIKDWDWPSSGPTPSLILEGGPEEWAYYLSADETEIERFREHGIRMEPYASYALCLYRAEGA